MPTNLRRQEIIKFFDEMKAKRNKGLHVEHGHFFKSDSDRVLDSVSSLLEHIYRTNYPVYQRIFLESVGRNYFASLRRPKTVDTSGATARKPFAAGRQHDRHRKPRKKILARNSKPANADVFPAEPK